MRIHDAGGVAPEAASEFAALRDPHDVDIGMAIVRLIAERHGGELESQTDANGTAVWVRLPD